MSQKYERLVEEDLNVGTELTWVCCPGSGELRATQVGIHSVARGQQAYEATWASGAIAAGSNASTTIIVKDAYLKDFVMVSHDKILTSALRISGHVSAAETVKVVIHNPTAASITVASGTLKVIVFPQCSAQVSAAADPLSVGMNTPVIFTPTATLGIPPYTYLWDFGDALPAVNPTDLYGYWPLDEAGGNSRASTLGTAPDLAEVGGVVPEDAAGRFSNAASSTEVAVSHLETALAPALAVSSGLTISLWFKWPAAPSLNVDSILDLDNGGAHVPPYFYIVRFFNSNYLEVVFEWTPGGAIGLPIPRLGPFAINTWHLVVITYDAISGVLTGRVDDGCLATAVVTSAPTSKQIETVPLASLATANASTFSRLRLLNGNFSNFEGSLDDLRIWTRVLTDDEIADIWYRSDEEISSYSYGEPGVQTVSLTATDADGCSVSDTVDVTVADFSVTVTAAQIEGGIDGDAIVEFHYFITGGTAPFTYSLAWTGGGGGGPSTDVDPTITFFGGVPLAFDTIPYTLTVTDDTLAIATYNGSVDIQYWDAP